MEPDHKEVRMNKDPEAQEYWESGLTTKTLSALKTGNVDHSQKSCYHCGCKGHIKANCPERRKLGARPWTKRPGPRVKKTAIRKGYGNGGGRRRRFTNKNGATRRRYNRAQKENAQALQQFEEDF